ncbi:protein-disulfide reductase DsbD domain-containing protein [Cyclobacterium jeungdonense]|uniref:Protein-disulfide reductase DsbD family protein n=1 Tax=Cyclobacterium jeungdonense TaxID=708087 RepID=A0ABT8C4P8_9BACT|nr:protein-disulfide reductase DsbD domain-containing protein [Cyclobacterium jeungdonense]MDN3687455.1 protein-disulfide reductase DsbD family protein [Cyclobacterium jeungdonense]
MSCLPLNKIFIWCYILLLQGSVLAQTKDRRFIEFKDKPEFTISTGDEKHLSLSFIIKEGYHIQANRVNDENLLPSKLSFESAEGLIIGDPVYPQADEFRMEGVKEPLAVFGDTLEIQVPVKTTDTMKKQRFLIKGQLYYQPCDASKCYYPREFDFNLSIRVK